LTNLGFSAFCSTLAWVGPGRIPGRLWPAPYPFEETTRLGRVLRASSRRVSVARSPSSAPVPRRWLLNVAGHRVPALVVPTWSRPDVVALHPRHRCSSQAGLRCPRTVLSLTIDPNTFQGAFRRTHFVN